jgi:hypothetical protein
MFGGLSVRIFARTPSIMTDVFHDLTQFLLVKCHATATAAAATWQRFCSLCSHTDCLFVVRIETTASCRHSCPVQCLVPEHAVCWETAFPRQTRGHIGVGVNWLTQQSDLLYLVDTQWHQRVSGVRHPYTTTLPSFQVPSSSITKHLYAYRL